MDEVFAHRLRNKDSLNGPKRDLAFSVVHLIGMAEVELERSLAWVEVRQGLFRERQKRKSPE
ncbi:hypothetical protein OH712_20285 [Pseudomonas capsici]|nr:hypothetical protein [Pseudomonas capsici]MCV4264900.1 hypothetical protein [Pseudomonas capsici]